MEIVKGLFNGTAGSARHGPGPAVAGEAQRRIGPSATTSLRNPELRGSRLEPLRTSARRGGDRVSQRRRDARAAGSSHHVPRAEALHGRAVRIRPDWTPWQSGTRERRQARTPALLAAAGPSSSESSPSALPQARAVARTLPSGNGSATECCSCSTDRRIRGTTGRCRPGTPRRPGIESGSDLAPFFLLRTRNYRPVVPGQTPARKLPASQRGSACSVQRRRPVPTGPRPAP